MYSAAVDYALCDYVVQARLMDPSKDLASYGYGSVAWKEKSETWRTHQDKLQLVRSEGDGNGSLGSDGDLPV
jgi:cellulose synthase A